MSSVPNTINQFGFDPLSEYLPHRPWLDDVDYESDVPLEYWITGNDIEPSKAAARVAQLRLFRDLYNAEYERFVRADALFAFHAYHTNYMARVLMSTPPEITTHEIIKFRTKEMINKALRNVVIDMIRYGTGLLFVQSGEYGAEVTAPQPIFWYPADDDTDVLIERFADNTANINISHNTGKLDVHNVKIEAGKISEMEGPDESQYGTDEHWRLVQENTAGRIGSIINIVREPSTGDWGQSLYPYITDLTLMYNGRQSQLNAILVDDGNPIMILLPNRNEPPIYGTDDAPASLKIQAKQIRCLLYTSPSPRD